MSNLAPQRYFLPTSGTRIVLPAPECSAELPWRRAAAASRVAAVRRLRPVGQPGVADAGPDIEAAPGAAAPHPTPPARMRLLPAPSAPAAPQDSAQAPAPLWAPALAAAVVLLLLLGAWAWSAVQRELEITRAALTASERRLTRAEVRQNTQDAALAQRVQRELGELHSQARGELRALSAGAQAADAARSAETHARLATLEHELHQRLDEERSAVRAAWKAHETLPDPEGLALKRIFARAREALLYIRTSYRVRLPGSGEEEELTSFGTGFLISRAGVAVTAQHVLYPWRYDRRLLASAAQGLAEVVAGSATVSVWLVDSQVTSDGSDKATYLTGGAYRLDGGHATVRILHTGQPDERTELVMSTLGPTAITMPRVGNGDLAVIQLIDPGRTFPALSLAAATRPAVLDAVLVLGYPLSRLQAGRAVPQVSVGRVRRTGGEMLELDAAVHPGNSGGPVLDRAGRVVGMASAILETPVYGLAMTADALQAAWRTVREQTAQQQRHLRALGCDPGATDGIPGARTQEAQQCAAALATGL